MTMVYSLQLESMDEIAISKFKATCLAVLKKVRKTRQPVRVTRFGEAIAEIVPPSPTAGPEPWLGALAGTGRICGDIVAPASEADDWEVLRS